MSVREKILTTRQELFVELGHPPSLTAVANIVGCSKEYVRRIYKDEGLNTREYIEYMPSRERRGEGVRIDSVESGGGGVVSKREEIIKLLQKDSDMRGVPYRHIAEQLGVSVSYVCSVALDSGLVRPRRGGQGATVDLAESADTVRSRRRR